MVKDNLKNAMFSNLGGASSHKSRRRSSADMEKDVIEVSAEDLETSVEKIRINVFITKNDYDFLRRDSAQSATTVAALCSIAIHDMVEERKKRRQNELPPALVEKLLDRIEAIEKAQKK
jgi:transcriptional/translational regulatory protein YebC/TACO1